MIGTLTLHHNSNYGANLQAYALIQAITQITDEEVVLVDYRNFHIDNLYSLWPFDITCDREIIFSVKAVKRVIKTLINPRGTVVRNYKFKQFRKKYIPMTKTVKSVRKINELGLNKLLIGSDQVWNTDITIDDEGAFWGAGVESYCKLYSYAPSLGKDEFNKKELEYAKKYLGNFDYLTVREAKLAEIVDTFIEGNAYVVCDPVLLLSQNEWKSFCKSIRYTKPFILIYQLGQDIKILETAREIAKARDWDIIYLNDGRKFRYMEVKHCKAATPIDFLSLINEAEVVMTDSFHCMVFSVIFNKDFFVFPYFRKIRITEFLNKIGLSARLIESNDCVEINKDMSIETYAGVNEILENIREESKKHLLKMING